MLINNEYILSEYGRNAEVNAQKYSSTNSHDGAHKFQPQEIFFFHLNRALFFFLY